MEPRYMTVGEVAERTGVTVRSVQYYDQQGIMSPSAKGPQNQRLYNEDDIERLNSVLCLKYAGLSLAQIREALDAGITAAEVRSIFTDAIAAAEESFGAMLRRYATLRSIADAVAGMEDGEVKWASLARSIENDGADPRMHWRLSCLYGEDVADGSDVQAGVPDMGREQVVTSWHEVISEAIKLMRTGEPMDSAASAELARRVVGLRRMGAHRPEGPDFLMLESAPASHTNRCASFDEMRSGVVEYLNTLVAFHGQAEATDVGDAAGK